MRTQPALSHIGLRLAFSGILAVSISLYSATTTSTPVSRIELIERLAPLIPLEKQMAGNYYSHYTDIDTLSDRQRLILNDYLGLILNGYLAQSKTKSGTSSTLFSPTMIATRAQAAVMIHRILASTNPSWNASVTQSIPLIDANTVPWAKKALTELANAAIIQPIGPGYMFPKRELDAQMATQWIDAAVRFTVKPEPIEIRPELTPTVDRVIAVPTPSATRPTATVVTVLTEPATPTEAHTKATQDYTWQVSMYGGLSLGQSPYQSNQPPAEVAEERYQQDTANAVTVEGYSIPEKKRTYGLESGIEFSRSALGQSIWLVAGYGYGIVKETMPATTIIMPVVYYEDVGGAPFYSAVATTNSVETFNFGEHIVRKKTHTIRLGLRHSLYEKTLPTARIEGYWGGGLAISTAAIWGSTIELPKQNINTVPLTSAPPIGSRETFITREKVRSFYHTQTQASVYGELGGLIARNALHVGIQARFQLNPGELSVDEKGNKRLNREITSLATLFVGKRF